MAAIRITADGIIRPCHFLLDSAAVIGVVITMAAGVATTVVAAGITNCSVEFTFVGNQSSTALLPFCRIVSRDNVEEGCWQEQMLRGGASSGLTDGIFQDVSAAQGGQAKL